MRVDFLFFSLLFIASIARSASAVPKELYLGISPQDANYYKSSSEIKCKDGSRKFSIAQLNDNFCDCPDGTDEPGTSACPNAKFHCLNAGHASQFLFSSRVNDGICDCCDGSDEYDGKANCSNTCWESGKVARDKLNKKVATYKGGVILRKQEIEQAKAALAKDEAELTKLKSEEKTLKYLVQQLKERNELIEKAEEKERLQKEREENEKKEAEEAAKKEKGEADGSFESDDKSTGSAGDDVTGTLEDSSLNQHAMENKEEASQSKDDSAGLSSTDEEADQVLNVLEDSVAESTEGLSKEELGRLVASRWTGGKTGEENAEADMARDSDHQGLEVISKESHEEEYDGYATETDDDTGKYYDDVEDDRDEADEEEGHHDSSSSYKHDVSDEVDLSDTSISNPSWLEKIQKSVRSILMAVNLFQTPIDKSEAAHVRKEYDDASAKLSKMQTRISSLTQKLKHDFGPEKEFYSFHGHCFEIHQNKYTYKICPFKEASQEEGHSTTRLGNWEKFDDSHRLMLFSNGEMCWNGPDRSMKVKLRCGLKNEMSDVDEPSRCEYTALLYTPALCSEDKLKELQQKLDRMNEEQPQKKDEL